LTIPSSRSASLALPPWPPSFSPTPIVKEGIIKGGIITSRARAHHSGSVRELDFDHSAEVDTKKREPSDAERNRKETSDGRNH
jgi:hypothetical protein